MQPLKAQHRGRRGEDDGWGWRLSSLARCSVLRRDAVTKYSPKQSLRSHA